MVDLFGEFEEPKKRDNQWEWDQFAKLGEMMGDGLHREPDGKWILKEYKRLMYFLCPEVKEQEKLKKQQIKDRRTKAMLKFFETNYCKKKDCGGRLYQRNPGTLICYCSACQEKYKVTTKKRKS